MTPHHFTFNDTQTYEAKEVADLLSKVYAHGKAKARIESRIFLFRVFASGFLTGAAGVILYQVIA